MRIQIVTSILLFFFAACSGPTVRPGPVGPTPVPASVKEALKIPPLAGTAEALERLGAEAKKGHCESAWLRVQYLIDLLDTARLHAGAGEDDAAKNPLARAHPLLWKALDLLGDPGRGRLATRQALDALDKEIGAAPPKCIALKDRLADARSLLQADRAPRQEVGDALRSAVTYKKIARSGSLLAPNARLRLAHWCLSAFRLAAGGMPAMQHARINHCLLPLYDADPSSYFDQDPLKRPPDPPWPVLRRALDAQLAGLQETRLAALSTDLSAAAKTFFSRAAPTLPTPLDLSRFHAPTNNQGAPWDRTPVVLAPSQGFYVGGRAVLPDDEEGLQKAMAARLAGDRRGRITLVTAADTPAAMVSYVGRAARLAGARTLALGVMEQVAKQAPASDVQYAVFGKRPVFRLHEIPVSLLLLSARASTPLARDRPRGMEYDPAAAKNSLMVRVDRGTFGVASKHGVLPPVRFKELLSTLRTLRRAYPDDTSLVLVPGAGATYDELVAVAGIARRDAGQPLFPGLALASRGHAQPSAEDLGPLLRLLSAATVSVTPPLTRALPLLLRRCYLDTLRTLKKKEKVPHGLLVLKERKGKLRLAGGTLKHRALRGCITRDVLSTQAATAGTKLTATFQVK